MRKIIILTGACIALITGCGVNLQPDDLVFNNSAQAVIDARKMIDEKIRYPEKYNNWIYSHNLPESLRIPNLKYAMVYNDHVSLVISRNPDWNIGARIWSEKANIIHKDKISKYKDIYFYEYTNDSPESPENIK